MRILKELAKTVGLTLLVLAVVAFCLILNDRWAQNKAKEREALVNKILDERLGPLERRIEELEKRGK